MLHISQIVNCHTTIFGHNLCVCAGPEIDPRDTQPALVNLVATICEQFHSCTLQPIAEASESMHCAAEHNTCQIVHKLSNIDLQRSNHLEEYCANQLNTKSFLE